MPVRRPRNGLRGKKKKAAPTSRVKGIKSDKAWEAAMAKSDNAYVVVHVMSGDTPASRNFKHTFSSFSTKKELNHMVFAEAVAANVKVLRKWAETKGPKFPAVLIYYQRKVLKVDFTVVDDKRRLHDKVLFQEVNSADAPKPGALKKLLVTGVCACAFAAAGVAAALFAMRNKADLPYLPMSPKAPAAAVKSSPAAAAEASGDDDWDDFDDDEE